MDGEAGEFQDWELLHNSDETDSVNSSDSVENTRGLERIEAESDGVIQTDYFSIDSQSKSVKIVAKDDASEESSPEFDNPSLTKLGYPRMESGDFFPDSDGEDRKFSEFEDMNKSGSVESPKSQLRFGGFGEIRAEGEDLVKFSSDSGGVGPISMEFGDLGRDTGMGIGSNGNSQHGSDLAAGEDDGSAAGVGLSSGNESAVSGEVRSGGQEGKRSVVWWKIPFEFLKYGAFRVSPVWTFSVAAAVLGFAILGRRLYKMKRKSRRLQVNVTMGDKKVSQFMTRAARLNEAFSAVKRVPVIRPSLPALGVTPWPVMSLR
ncbi:hypothetical protein U1Q18_027892 [Sarracenia purpurea var. burkii]